MVLTIPAFAFPAETGTYLPTLEGWKAELVCLDPAVGFSELLAELISPAKQVLGVWIVNEVVTGKASPMLMIISMFHNCAPTFEGFAVYYVQNTGNSKYYFVSLAIERVSCMGLSMHPFISVFQTRWSRDTHTINTGKEMSVSMYYNRCNEKSRKERSLLACCLIYEWALPAHPHNR